MNCFNYNDYYKKINNISKCNLCEKDFKTVKKFNLKLHLEKIHKLVFDKKDEKKQLLIYKKKSFKCELSKNLMIKSYIGLVTEDALPFNVLNSENMRNWIEPICKGIEKDGGKKFCLNADNCKKTLTQVAGNVINSISGECKNKLISLKMDSASRLSRNIFGISAQFVKNDKIESRILGMVELKGQNSSSSKKLAAQVLSVLNKYDINLQQIVTITSDSCSNMLKCTKILSHSCAEDYEYEENYNNETYFQNIDLVEKKYRFTYRKYSGL